MNATLVQPAESKEQPQVASPEQQKQPEAPAPPPSLEERIRVRAYELFELRARAPGDPDEDWYRAEAEVIGQPGETDH